MFIKNGIFTVAIDDAPHKRDHLTTELVFVVCRGFYLEHFTHAIVDVDGLNSTDTILKELDPIIDQFQIVLTHGITTAGFNLIDIERIFTELNKPIISVTENAPKGQFKDAIRNLPDYKVRKSIIKRAGEQHSYVTPAGKNPVFFQYKGLELKTVQQFLKKFSKRSRLPEQLLLAHKIASGL
jgi:endonuclease V-like protein UPF0215 family